MPQNHAKRQFHMFRFSPTFCMIHRNNCPLQQFTKKCMLQFVLGLTKESRLTELIDVIYLLGCRNVILPQLKRLVMSFRHKRP